MSGGGEVNSSTPPFACSGDPAVRVRVPVEQDAARWHALFDDPAVMRWIGDGSVRDLVYYERFVAGEIRSFAEHGWGLATVELVATGAPDVADGPDRAQVVGFVGVHRWNADWGPTGEIEIGWRLGRRFWGRGIATCAARQVLASLPGGADGAMATDLVAMIQVGNDASAAVAGKIGMARASAHPLPGGERWAECWRRSAGQPD